MNIIQQQANDFIRIRFDEHGKYEEFIQSVRSQLYEYRKDSHKLEFTDKIIVDIKKLYDKHLEICKFPDDALKCFINKNYENVLFFLQNERDELIERLPIDDFSITERNVMNGSLQEILNDLSLIKLGQELTYDDLKDELSDLKDFYFLNKKTWSQLLIGRLTEMVASGVISETISKEIVETVTKNYSGLIS